jgi:hypothetical protein
LSALCCHKVWRLLGPPSLATQTVEDGSSDALPECPVTQRRRSSLRTKQPGRSGTLQAPWSLRTSPASTLPGPALKHAGFCLSGPSPSAFRARRFSTCRTLPGRRIGTNTPGCGPAISSRWASGPQIGCET